MPSPAPCPTPAGCPTPQPCSEVFDAQCVVYTGENLLCDVDVVVSQNDTVAEALENVVDYFCNNVGQPGPQGPVGPQGPQGVPGTGADVSLTSIGTGLSLITDGSGPSLQIRALNGGAGITVGGSLSGELVIINTDPGSSQNIFKNVAVSGQSTVVADSNNDTLTFVAGTGIGITTDATTDSVTITNSAPNVVQNTYTTFTGNTGSSTANSPTDSMQMIGDRGLRTIIGTDSISVRASYSYEIGEYIPAEGGIIVDRWISTLAYGTPTNSGSTLVQNYLVIPIVDIDNAGNYDFPFQTATFPALVGGTTSWNGLANTAILAASPLLAPTDAAKFTNSWVYAGQSDWWLPSSDELLVIFKNKIILNRTLDVTPGAMLLYPSINSYQSSTEQDASISYYGETPVSRVSNDSKVNLFRIRPLRRFNIPV